MFRVGLFTGKIYPSEMNVSEIKECCIIIASDDLDAGLKVYEDPSLHCTFCGSCEEYQRRYKNDRT